MRFTFFSFISFFGGFCYFCFKRAVHGPSVGNMLQYCLRALEGEGGCYV